MTPPGRITPTRANFVFGVVFVLVFGAMVWWRSGGASPADIPPEQLAAFADGLTLAEAQERSAQSGRPVLVYATASWCAPCRGFKAETLSREEVAGVITASFEPVYLDIDKAPGEARSLRVMVVPTIMVLRDGLQVDRHEGVMEPAEFVAFLARQRTGEGAAPGG